MRDQQTSSPFELRVSSPNMASTASNNVNGKIRKKNVILQCVIKNSFILIELLPGLESFLRSMLTSAHLDQDRQQIAAMYVSKLDELTKQASPQQTSLIDDQSL